MADQVVFSPKEGERNQPSDPSKRCAPLRVMFVIDAMVTGGAETLLCATANALAARGDTEVLIASLFPVWNEAWRLDQERIRLVSLDMRAKYDFLRGRSRLIRAVADFQPDIVHVHLFPADIVAALASRSGHGSRVPLVFTEHTEWNRRRASPLYRLLDRWTYSHYNRVVCVSERVRAALVAWLPDLSDHAIVLPNAVQVPQVTWQISDHSETDILFVGRLDPAKGLDVLIQALRILRDQGKPYRLSVVGDGVMRQVWERRAHAENVADLITFTGRQSDVEQRMLSARVLTLPSNWEGMSMVLLEGMALGMPIVATRVSGTDELIQDGKSGVLVPPKDPERLAEALSSVLEQPALAQTLGTHARRQISEHNTIDKYADRLRLLYESDMSSFSAASTAPASSISTWFRALIPGGRRR